jgi:hypothetical protein
MKKDEVGHVALNMFGKPEGNRPLERPRHRWEDNTECLLGM